MAGIVLYFDNSLVFILKLIYIAYCEIINSILTLYSNHERRMNEQIQMNI
jgi:hypothetical protein